MSAKVLVLYQRPIDPVAFDQYYKTTHIPLAKQLPDLRSFETARGDIVDPVGASPYFQIATLTFDSMDDLKAALSSGAGQSVTHDVPNFASGGATVLIFESQEV